MQRKLFRGTVALLVVTGAWAAPTPPASAAAMIEVTQSGDGDSGPGCTLRQAIRAANLNTSVLFCFHPGTTGPDTILVPAGTYSLSLTGSDDTAEDGDLDITDDLTIVGAGADRTTIDASGMGNERVFHILAGVDATINGFTITGGTDSGFTGGGVLNVGALTLDAVRITDNATSAAGGGISNTGALVVRRSVIDHNIAFAGAGLQHAAGTATLVATTVSGNSASASGGGINSSAPGTLTHVTITDNEADRDPGDIFAGDGGGLVTTGNLALARSILAGNVDGSPGAEAPDCSGGPISQGHNVVGDDTGCSFVPQATDRVGVDAGIAPALTDNGGPTPTHALRASSPARDLLPAGNAACGGADQRRVPRPFGAGCDAGAYERASCMDRIVNIVGTPGPDSLVGTSAPDGVLGLAGADLVRSLGGNDRVCGGPGADTIRLGAGSDRARGDGGRDLILGGGGRDILRGNGGADRLRGGGGSDQLFGGPGRDGLAGGPGVDRCRQGPGSGPVSSCEA